MIMRKLAVILAVLALVLAMAVPAMAEPSGQGADNAAAKGDNRAVLISCSEVLGSAETTGNFVTGTGAEEDPNNCRGAG